MMMTHEQALERLDDFAGGELAPAEHAAVQRHLHGCGECRAEVEALRSLLDEARFLPREIAPPRDLWAGISARLEPRAAPAAVETERTEREAEDPKVIPFRPRSTAWQPPRWVLAAAAALVLMVGSSVGTLMVVERWGGGREVAQLPGVAANPPSSAVAAPTALVAFRPAEQGYQAAIDDLAALLETRRDQLAPETVATLERNLRIVDQAIAESRAALERDPNSRELAQMLSGVYDTKVKMLQQAVEL